MTLTKLTGTVQSPDFVRPRRQLRYDWAAIAETAVEANGDWILVSELMNRGYVTQIRNGRIRVFQPAGAFDARCKVSPLDDEKVELYIRYLEGETNGAQ